MTGRGERPESVRNPAFDRIDRRIAMAFMTVTAVLMAVVVVVGSALYVDAVRTERERLSVTIADVLGPSLEGLKTAGAYKMQRLAETLTERNPTIAFIRVVEPPEGAFVHAGAASPSVAAHDADVSVAVRTAAAVRTGAGEVVRDLSIGGRPVTEVAIPLRAGYRGAWTAVLRIGIWGEPPGTLLVEAVAISGGLLAALVLVAFPLLLWLGRRLGAPVQALAQDFEGVMRHAPLHITIEDSEGRIETASDTFLAAFDLRPDARTMASDVFPPEVLAAGPEDHTEIAMRVGGEERTSRFPVALSERGDVVRSGLISTDVTAWRRDQAERDQMIAAVASTGDQILVATAADGVVYANPAFYQRSGHPTDAVRGRDPLTLVAGDAAEAGAPPPWRAAIGVALSAGEPWSGRIAARCHDGAPYPCDLGVFPIRDQDGALRAHVWSARDVSVQAALEAQLLQTQRMEATGRLAGGVAHDFNNLLTVINGMTELLQGEELDEELLTTLRVIRDAGRRAAVLTRQLLAFGRRQTLNIETIDLNAVISGTLELLKSALGSRVAVEVDACEGLWPTRGDVGQLDQALMNLAINAHDAMPDQGTLRIATANATLVGAREADGTVVPDGDYAVLTVSDSGIGMDAAVMAHIFEPFFTTKEVGKGTGLGLAMVHGMVRQSGGHIWVASEPGVGTTFRVAFPRAPDGPTVRPPTRPPPGQPRPAPGTLARVLVVDDEEGVRLVIAGMLRQGGYRVETAAGGDEALQVVAAARPPIDLVVSDLMMPGMNGVELAKALRERWPGLRILFVSGYSAQSAGLVDELRGEGLIEKPPEAATLLEIVRNALGAPEPDRHQASPVGRVP